MVRQAVIRTSDLVLRKDALRGLVGRAAATATLPIASSGSASLKEIAEEAARSAERQAICDTLRRTHGNQSQAARILATDYKTLYLKMKRLGIRPRDFQP